MNIRTAHKLYPPQYISSSVQDTLDNPKKDLKSNTYTTGWIPMSSTSQELKDSGITLPKKRDGSPNYSKAAALADLVNQAREANQSDGTHGLVKSKISDPISAQLVPINQLEIDHFHPKGGEDGFIARMDALDEALSQRSNAAKTFIRKLKQKYPTNEDANQWQWKDFIVKTGETEQGGDIYQLKSSYRIRAYNYIDNLWLIPGTHNKSFGDRHKIPKTGQHWTTSPLAEVHLFGQDFLKLFGTVDNQGTFSRTKINSNGIIDMATFRLKTATGKPTGNTLTGLGKIGRDWFTYRYSQISQPQKSLTLQVSSLTELTEQLAKENLSDREKKQIKAAMKRALEEATKQVDLL